ncbi:Nucleolin [Dactylella cylindrospora]|nr:Nucleolin [Dactylella cylindrospora]
MLEARQKFEFRLRNSYGQADEGQNWSDYIEWESSRRHVDVNLCQGLYERCVLRYPMESTVWEEYMYFMLEKKNGDPVILTLLERATAHCQWSGSLWSHRLLAFDVRQQPFESIERIKHQATESRLMVSPEEIFKVHLAWCGVLKRRGAVKDPMVADMDLVAELGIRSAMSEIGTMDPDYRIARLLITFLTDKGDLQSAEAEWKQLIPGHSSQYEFWLRYYGWAFRNTGNLNATEVLRKAVLNWKDMDWPEKIVDVYHTQIEEHGQGTDIEGAMLHIRRLRKQIAKRREHEALAAQAQESASSPWSGDVKGKRRRSNVEDDELPHKKARASEDIEMESIPPVPEETGDANGEAPVKETAKPRDREKFTVFAKNLPPDTDDLSVRKFFKDCGTINALNIVVEGDGESATASVEFQNAADVLAAQTRDKKLLNGREVAVELGYNSTVYVTNFPPVVDEQWIRELFQSCGQIVQVRFPSLKYNTHRRFCYVQFENSEDAEKAAQFDGREVEGYTLVSKLSDPDKKQERSGPVHEGREIFVRNIDFDAREEDLRELFSKYGTIENIRLAKKDKGFHSGFGFIDFETADAAEASLELNGHKLKSRKLMVVMGVPQGGAPASKKSSGKTQPKAPNGAVDSPAAAASPMSTTTSDQPDRPNRDAIRQKTLFVLNVADTVNDSKIRATFEKYGSLRKVQLRLDHQAAIVEFDEVKDAGKAAMALEGHEIDGRAIRFGEYQDMVKTAPEKKAKPGENPFARKRGQEKQPMAATNLIPTRVHRPNLSVRGGKSRVGLGFRSSRTEKTEETENGEAKPKTNAQFRQMLLKGKAEETEDKE